MYGMFLFVNDLFIHFCYGLCGMYNVIIYLWMGGV